MDLLVHSRCPGKLILSGEHSTVYGKNAVAVTVDMYTEVKVYCGEPGTDVKLVLENFQFQYSWPVNTLKQVLPIVKPASKFVYNEQIVERIHSLLESGGQSLSTNVHNSCVAFLLLYLSVGDISHYSDRKSIEVHVSSKLPNGAGLGSSSSYIVSLAKALFTAHNADINQADFNAWCYEVDKLFHGKPSGVDNTICTYGGAILFRQGNIIEKIANDDLPQLSELKVVLVNTNVPRNTKAMVERCRVRLNCFPDIVNNILESIGMVTQNVWDVLKSKNLELLPKLFTMNQHLLNCLDVGHEQIDKIVNISHKYDLAAKLTGAGGGGIVFVLVADKGDQETMLIEELESNGFKCYNVKLCVGGVHNL